jgi:hypothetical protein
MANVFGILTAIVLLLATFAAYRNKDAYANEIAHRKTEEQKLANSRERLQTAKDNLAATQKERAETEAQVAQLKTQEADQKKANDGLKEDIETKTKTVAANKLKLDEIRTKTAPIGEIKELAKKVKTMRTEMEETTQSIATNEAKLANLTSENTRVEGVIEVLRSQEGMVARRESYFTKTQINSIYPNWGFVTLAAGNTSGLVTGSTLEVVRNGATVAKLLVTAVESNTASASIIPDSVAQDVVLMVGDQVQPSHKPAPAPAAAKPAKPALPPTADPKPADKPDAAADPSLNLGPDPTTVTDPKPEAAPEPKPEAEPEAKPEAAPEAKPDAAPEAKPEAAPEAAPEATPEATPEAKPEAAPEAE